MDSTPPAAADSQTGAPPPLIAKTQTSAPPPLIADTQTCGPPPLIAETQICGPPPLIADTQTGGPPPLIAESQTGGPPPLIAETQTGAPPPLIAETQTGAPPPDQLQVNAETADVAVEAILRTEQEMEEVARMSPTLQQAGGGTLGRGGSSHARGRGRFSGTRGRERNSSIQLTSESSHMEKSVISEVQTSFSAQPPVKDFFWCDICRVECNSSDSLESHKNGQRHKKTIQRVEEFEKKQKQLAEYEAKYALGVPVPAASQPVPMNDLQAEAIKQLEMVVKRADENLAAEGNGLKLQNVHVVDGHETKYSQESQSILDQPENGTSQNETTKTDGIAPETTLEKIDDPNTLTRAPKRKKSAGGRGGKKSRISEPGQLIEQPVICTFCSVACDTQAVFETHLVGRKHIRRFGQYQGMESVLGPLGYFGQPHAQFPTLKVPPLFYGFQSQLTTPTLPEGVTPCLMSSTQPFPTSV